MTATQPTVMTAAAAELCSHLRIWSEVAEPVIGSASCSTTTRLQQARGMQSAARELAAKIEAMGEDEMEAFFISRGFPHTANWDVHGGATRGLVQKCFNAAMDRYDAREGFRRNERGYRERRTATGTWETY